MTGGPEAHMVTAVVTLVPKGVSLNNTIQQQDDIVVSQDRHCQRNDRYRYITMCDRQANNINTNKLINATGGSNKYKGQQ